MLGSLDYMHWKWKNCQKALQVQYQGYVKKPTIILESVASHDFWIWHAFSGMPGSHNDINVLQQSSLFARLTEGKAPPCHYTVNRQVYNMDYFIVSILRRLPLSTPSLIQFAIKNPTLTKDKKQLEKDAERAVGVLQSYFAVVCGLATQWDSETLLGL